MQKKIIFLLLLIIFSLAFIAPTNCVLAENKKDNETAQQKVLDHTPPILKENILISTISLYGPEKAPVIYKKIMKMAEAAYNERSEHLKIQDKKRTFDWYKDEIIYTFYADQFGVKKAGKTNKFKDLIGMLDYLEDLGVTTLYILPFMNSPMGDAGFDVKNPKDVRKDLGGMKQFKKFAKEARKRGFKLKADLVLNHFSDQHEWFQELKSGKLENLKYFVYRDTPPRYKRYFADKKGIFIDYYEDNGLISTRRLIFPEMCENNYRKQRINNKDYYFYHTFYPFQMDVNWKNPEVLYYVLETMSQWSNSGIDIFRLDATPYFIKEAGTNGANHPKTHYILNILSSFMQIVAPRTVLQAEAASEEVKKYFGKEQVLKDNYIRTNEVQIAYNFQYMTALWTTMLAQDNNFFWETVDSIPKVPDSTAWGMFLRVHDEITLEIADPQTREIIYNQLVTKGEEFRKGFGVSGRMANFLDNNPQRIHQAFSILFSMPGIPIIYYGDEIGAQNNFKFAKKFAEQRENTQKKLGNASKVVSYYDSRDINRGPVLKKAFYKAMKKPESFSGQIYNRTKYLIKKRKEYSIIRKGSLAPVKSDKNNVFSYIRSYKGENVLIINNLTDSKNTAKLTFPDNLKSDGQSYIDILGDKKINVINDSNKMTINLKPYESIWLKL